MLQVGDCDLKGAVLSIKPSVQMMAEKVPPSVAKAMSRQEFGRDVRRSCRRVWLTW